MDAKPRWATIIRPSRSMRHLVGRADSKLLSETRMGSVRSLSYHANPHRTVLGHACPCCGGAEDTASHMLQCGVSIHADANGCWPAQPVAAVLCVGDSRSLGNP